jgi:transglutaminase-like putative cysteine protease
MSLPVRLALLVSLAATVVGGGFPAVLAVLGVLATVAPPLRLRGSWTPVHLAMLVACAGLAVVGTVLDGFGALVVYLVVHRRTTCAGPTDERVALLLATLLLLLASVASVSPLLAPVYAAFALVAPAALMRTVLGTPARQAEIGAGVACSALAGLFFLGMPRLQGGLLDGLREGPPADSFPREVALGDELPGQDDAALVMRVRATDRDGAPTEGPFYLRGRALDHFDGTRWTSTREGSVGRATRPWTIRAEVLLEPLASDVLFGIPDVVKVEGDVPGFFRDGNGNFIHRAPGRRLEYVAYAVENPLTSVRPADAAYTQVPTLDPRVVALAQGLASEGATPGEVIAAALHLLADGFSYTEDPPAPTGDPLAWFLLESRTGHCEYYASALAMLLRLRGVPTRLATGFYTEEVSDAGGYVAVRQGHAHAWVEVAVPGGWASLDASPTNALPTPEVSFARDVAEALASGWYRLVLDYDLDAQVDGLARVGSVFVPATSDPIRSRSRQGAAGFVVAAGALLFSGLAVRLGLWMLSRPRPRGYDRDAALAAFGRARRLAARRGWAIPEELPPVSAGAWLEAHAGEPALLELAWALYRSRYGDQPAGDPREAMRRIRRMKKKGRGRLA